MDTRQQITIRLRHQDVARLDKLLHSSGLDSRNALIASIVAEVLRDDEAAHSASCPARGA
jgi:metal-responsive CopG/Arc/MetJ family transcriptional regulator